MKKEYLKWKDSEGKEIEIKWQDRNSFYEIYIDGVSTFEVSSDIDYAILIALGYKNLGDNNRFAHYAEKMLK